VINNLGQASQYLIITQISPIFAINIALLAVINGKNNSNAISCMEEQTVKTSINYPGRKAGWENIYDEMVGRKSLFQMGVF
jgi:hypothetical protein